MVNGPWSKLNRIQLGRADKNIQKKDELQLKQIRVGNFQIDIDFM